MFFLGGHIFRSRPTTLHSLSLLRCLSTTATTFALMLFLALLALLLVARVSRLSYVSDRLTLAGHSPNLEAEDPNHKHSIYSYPFQVQQSGAEMLEVGLMCQTQPGVTTLSFGVSGFRGTPSGFTIDLWRACCNGPIWAIWLLKIHY